MSNTATQPTRETVLDPFGIDVSKATLDICYLRLKGQKPAHAKFQNTPDGHDKLLTWCKKQSAAPVLRFCLEATGPYGTDIARFLHDARHYVSIVNPAHIKYSGPNGARNKTDKADALKIAQFAKAHDPEAFTPRSDEQVRLNTLKRHQTDLTNERGMVAGRLKDPRLDRSVRASWEKIEGLLTKEIEEITKEITLLIAENQEFATDHGLLQTIRGVGASTAVCLMTEVQLRLCKSAQSAAAYAGLSPKEFQSGTSVRGKTRISKAGNTQLRAGLYWATISAMQWNPIVRAFANRLKASGKCNMVVIVAAMRKLIMIAYGVLKSGKPFDAQYVPKGA